jgi:hypothetical protein
MPATCDERAKRIRDLLLLVREIEADVSPGLLTRGEVREGLRAILAAVIRDRVGSALSVEIGSGSAWTTAGGLRPIRVARLEDDSATKQAGAVLRLWGLAASS